MRYTILSLCGLVVAGLWACAPREEAAQQTLAPAIDETQLAFFENLRGFSGMRFAGFASHPTEGDHILVGNELRVLVSTATEDAVRIELYREAGEVWHGAWVVEKRDEGLHLFHDHLGEKRSAEELGDDDYHGYGGYATGVGTETRQFFPADEVTAEMIPEAATNVWMIEFDAENGTFTYSLDRHGELRFRAELNLQELGGEARSPHRSADLIQPGNKSRVGSDDWCEIHTPTDCGKDLKNVGLSGHANERADGVEIESSLDLANITKIMDV